MKTAWLTCVLVLSLSSVSTAARADNADTKKEKRERAAMRLLDLVEEALINFPANTWTALLPENIRKPKIFPLPLTLGTSMYLTVQREVHRAEGDQERFGRFAVRDVFTVFAEAGPVAQVPLPIPLPLSLDVGAKLAVMKEWVAVRFVDDEKLGYTENFWQRYGLPWQITKRSTLKEAFTLPAGTALLASDYVDFTGRLGVSFTALTFDFGGPRVDLSRFRSGGKLIFRESEDTIRVIHETGTGFSVRPHFPVYFIILYLEIYNRDYIHGKYRRKTYTFSRNDAEERFARALKGKSRPGDPAPEYSLDSKVRSRIFTSMVFFLWQLPKKIRVSEELTYTSASGAPDHFEHAFAVRETRKERRTAEVKVDLADDGAAEDSSFSVRYRYGSGNGRSDKLARVVRRVNAIAGGAPLVDCDLTLESNRDLGIQDVRLDVVMNRDAIARLRSASDSAACLAFETPAFCAEPLVYRRHLNFARLHRARRFLSFLKALRNEAKPGAWAEKLVGFVANAKDGEPYLGALIRLAGDRGVFIHASVEAKSWNEKEAPYPVCDQSVTRGDDVVDEIFAKFEEPVLHEITQTSATEPRPARLVRTPGENP